MKYSLLVTGYLLQNSSQVLGLLSFFFTIYVSPFLMSSQLSGICIFTSITKFLWNILSCIVPHGVDAPPGTCYKSLVRKCIARIPVICRIFNLFSCHGYSSKINPPLSICSVVPSFIFRTSSKDGRYQFFTSTQSGTISFLNVCL